MGQFHDIFDAQGLECLRLLGGRFLYVATLGWDLKFSWSRALSALGDEAVVPAAPSDQS